MHKRKCTMDKDSTSQHKTIIQTIYYNVRDPNHTIGRFIISVNTTQIKYRYEISTTFSRSRNILKIKYFISLLFYQYYNPYSHFSHVTLNIVFTEI